MARPARAPRADAEQTRSRILDASERLFSEHGYSGTSLRAIADAAAVNVASANYHFGSKAELMQATVQRAAAPINAARLARLDELQAERRNPSLREIVRAFVEPVLQSDRHEALPQILLRLFAEPGEIARPLLEQTFEPVAVRYLAALDQALPGLSPATLRQRFTFIIGAMQQTARFGNEPPAFLRESTASRKTAVPTVDALVAFTVAGLKAPEPQEARK